MGTWTLWVWFLVIRPEKLLVDRVGGAASTMGSTWGCPQVAIKGVPRFWFGSFHVNYPGFRNSHLVPLPSESLPLSWLRVRARDVAVRNRRTNNSSSTKQRHMKSSTGVHSCSTTQRPTAWEVAYRGSRLWSTIEGQVRLYAADRSNPTAAGSPTSGSDHLSFRPDLV